MSARFVPDASVAVKWFLEEPESRQALQLVEGDVEICAPQLLAIEIAAAIVRRFREGFIEQSDAEERLQEAETVLLEPRVRLVPDHILLPRAQSIALQIRHSLQDCLYVACAERVGMELISADAKLILRAAPHFPFVRAL